jgi:hypothetical protein
MFAAWGLTKAACRMIEMFTGRGLKMFTRGEGIYTGRSLILFAKKGRLTDAAKTWRMFTAWGK